MKAAFSIRPTGATAPIDTPGRMGIMVNTEGRRFIDEGEDFHAYTYAKTGAEILKQPGGIAYQIFDKKLEDCVSTLFVRGRHCGESELASESWRKCWKSIRML